MIRHHWETKRSVCIVAFLLIIAACGPPDRKHVAFNVISDPPGAMVESIIQHKSFIDGKEDKFANADLGISPTGMRMMYFAFGAPGAAGTKLGVRVTKEGYEPYEVLFEATDWHDTEEEARTHVRDIAVVLKKQ